MARLEVQRNGITNKKLRTGSEVKQPLNLEVESVLLFTGGYSFSELEIDQLLNFIPGIKQESFKYMQDHRPQSSQASNI